MKITTLVNDILNSKNDIEILQKHQYTVNYTNKFYKPLNAKVKLLLSYLKDNNLIKHYDLLASLIPINHNALEFLEILIAIKDEILEFDKYNNPQARLKLINTLAYYMQEKYVRNEIDCIFTGLGIVCGDEFYTYNSKRVYVQNVLQNANTMLLLKLAKNENILQQTIQISDTSTEITNAFINEQIEKCNRKIVAEDFDGAITNARSLLEEVLLAIEAKITGSKHDYNGDLPKLYKRVRKILNLEPNNDDTENSLNEITRGFTSIISGLSAISNNLSDRHARKYKPAKRHSMLCVNAAFTICQFLLESYEFQYNN